MLQCCGPNLQGSSSDEKPPGAETVGQEQGETVTATQKQTEKDVTGSEEREGKKERGREGEGGGGEGGPTNGASPAANQANQEIVKEADLPKENRRSDSSDSTATRVVSCGPPPPTPDLPYTEPHWSGCPSQSYSLTVIKSGSVLEEIDLSTKPFLVLHFTHTFIVFCIPIVVLWETSKRCTHVKYVSTQLPYGGKYSRSQIYLWNLIILIFTSL